MDSTGNFVITWPDGSLYSVYGRRYDAAGNSVGDSFLVNTATADRRRQPSVAMDDNGNFVIAWEVSPVGVDISDVYARQFSMNAGSQAPAALSVGAVAISSFELSQSVTAADPLPNEWAAGDGGTKNVYTSLVWLDQAEDNDLSPPLGLSAPSEDDPESYSLTSAGALDAAAVDQALGDEAEEETSLELLE